MYDIDIHRVLFALPNEIKQKTIFINKQGPSTRTYKKMQKVGKVYEMDCATFADEIKKIQDTYTPKQNDKQVYSFELITEKKYSNSLQSKILDVHNLFIYGDYNSSLIYNTLITNYNDYYVRREEIDTIIDYIKNKRYKNIVIRSDFGNGKTLLLEGIMIKCAHEQIPCYFLKEKNEYTKSDIDTIVKKNDQHLIIIENYARHKDLLLQIFQTRNTNTILLLTERTQNNEILVSRFEELRDESTKYFPIDTLDADAIQQLIHIMEKNAFWGDYINESISKKTKKIAEQYKASFAQLLLDQLNSKDIKDRISTIINELSTKTVYRNIVIIACIFNLLDYKVRFNQALGILQADKCNLVPFETNNIIKQFFNFQDDAILIKSSIFAHFILLRLTSSSNVLCEMLVKIYKYAIKKQNILPYMKEMRKDLEKFSTIQHLSKQTGKIDFADDYYESLKTLNRNEFSYHFWLQFAISKTVSQEYIVAAKIFETAFGLCKKLREVPYKLRNYYSRFLLERAIHLEDFSTYEHFMEANTIIQEQIHQTDKTIYFPYRNTSLYPQYYEKWKKNFTNTNQEHFLQQIKNILDAIAHLDKSLSNNKYVVQTQKDLLIISQSIEENKL